MARKRLLCLLFAALLLFTTVPVASASSGVYFTMLNSNAPDALQSGTMPFVRNGNIYVPQSVLTRLGISVTRWTGGLLLSSGDLYVMFDQENGSNTTSAGGSLSAAPLSRSGTNFFPVGSTGSATGALAAFFGINFQIVQTEPAPTVRLYTALGPLSHAAVQRNGDSLFRLTYRYNTFTGNVTDEADNAAPDSPAQPPSDPITPDGAADSPDEPNNPAAAPVSLSFVGLTAETDALLDALRRTGIPAGFFVTAADALAYPDLVRRLHGEGHYLGIYLIEYAEAEYAAASQALFEAARLRTVLVAASARDVAREADDLGLVVFDSPVRPIPNRDASAQLTGNLLLENNGNTQAISALPGIIRSNALRVVSFVSSLF